MTNLKYLISIDSGSDLNIQMLKMHSIISMHTSYILNEQKYTDNFNYEGYKTLYDNIRKGNYSNELNNNVYVYLDFFYKLLNENLPILHICTSLKNYQYANEAKELIIKNFPNASIYITYSNKISLGVGMLALHASYLRFKGLNIVDVVNWIESNKNNINSYIAKDNLESFEIKDYKKCDEDKLSNILEDTLFITHSDNEENAYKFGENLKNKYGFKNVFYSYMGPSAVKRIGIDSLAIFFYNKKQI